MRSRSRRCSCSGSGRRRSPSRVLPAARLQPSISLCSPRDCGEHIRTHIDEVLVRQGYLRHTAEGSPADDLARIDDRVRDVSGSTRWVLLEHRNKTIRQFGRAVRIDVTRQASLVPKAHALKFVSSAVRHPRNDPIDIHDPRPGPAQQSQPAGGRSNTSKHPLAVLFAFLPRPVIHGNTCTRQEEATPLNAS